MSRARDSQIKKVVKAELEFRHYKDRSWSWKCRLECGHEARARVKIDRPIARDAWWGTSKYVREVGGGTHYERHPPVGFLPAPTQRPCRICPRAPVLERLSRIL